MKRIAFSLLALVPLLCASCGGKGLYPVTGQVLFNGAPATGATVYFQRHGAIAEQVIIGIVQDDGTFELTCGAHGKGVPVGTYDVLIAWRMPGTTRKDCCERLADKLGGRYNDYKNPRFHAVVEAKANLLPPFHLK